MTARIVARAYVLSIPVFYKENDLIPLMNANLASFVEGGKATQCMQAMGAALVQGGLTAGIQYRGLSATELFGGHMVGGLELLPGQVDSTLRSYGSDIVAMGPELLWLSQVLPPAARGNYTPYKTTSTRIRQMSAQVPPVCRMICQMDLGNVPHDAEHVLQTQPVLEQ